MTWLTYYYWREDSCNTNIWESSRKWTADVDIYWETQYRKLFLFLVTRCHVSRLWYCDIERHTTLRELYKLFIFNFQNDAEVESCFGGPSAIKQRVKEPQEDLRPTLVSRAVSPNVEEGMPHLHMLLRVLQDLLPVLLPLAPGEHAPSEVAGADEFVLL